MNTTSELCHSE